MQGYHNRPDATVESWRNLWFHTGDAGYLAYRGRLHYADRLKDRIRRRGENISARPRMVSGSAPPRLRRAPVARRVGPARRLGSDPGQGAQRLRGLLARRRRHRRRVHWRRILPDR